MNRRVVVTGIGIVSPNGINKTAFAASLKEGISGIRPVCRFSQESLAPVAAEVEGVETDGQDRAIAFALRASHEALEESGLLHDSASPDTFGSVFCSSKGDLASFNQPDRFMYHFPTSSVSTALLQRFPQLQGPSLNLVAACATGTFALIRGAQLIREGRCRAVLAGAADASMTPLLVAAYRQMGVLSEETMRPFDRYRSGFVVGEGAAALILEERDSARRRGAKSYGEIVGEAMVQDSFHPVRFCPQSHSLAAAIRQTLCGARLSPEKLDYLNAHGTATQTGDPYETREIKEALGEAAYRIPVSATKSMTGHLLGASGAVEFAACLLAMEGHFIPPTLNLEEPDEACDLDYVPGEARAARLRTVLSVSMGFGGHIGAILVKK